MASIAAQMDVQLGTGLDPELARGMFFGLVFVMPFWLAVVALVTAL